MDNPFDWVKNLNRSVEFVAESDDAKDFKMRITKVVDTTATPKGRVHCIVGDYGSGKSHINHYLLESAKKSGDVLVAYVSCKDLLDIVQKGQTLYGALLKDIILKFVQNADSNVSEFIDEKFRLLGEDKEVKLLEEKKKAAKTETESEGLERAIERLIQSSTLNKESFFKIIDELEEFEAFKEKYKRTVIIVDELEVLARPTRRADLEKVVALRENITKRPNLFWVFSCAFSSFDRLSKDTHSTDMFGQQGVAEAHFIPNYDRKDRKRMILSRMDNRPSIARNKKSADEKRFPFSNLTFGNRDKLWGGEITQILTRPELSPRILMAACYDFFEDYNQNLRNNKGQAVAFEEARKSLLEKHFFNLINEAKFNQISDKVLGIIKTRFPTKIVDNDELEERVNYVLQKLFKVYLTHRSRKIRGRYGFDSVEGHLQYVDSAIMKILGHKISDLSKKAEEILRENCLEERLDVRSEKTILSFKMRDYQPVGILPHMSITFHEYIDKRTEKEVIDIDLIKDLFKEFLDKGKRTFDDDLYEQTINDLVETGKIEKAADSTNKFRILERKTESMENQFVQGIQDIKSKTYKFSSLKSYLKNKYFKPPLVGNLYEVIAPCRSSIKLKRKRKLDVYFWESIPIDANQRLLENDFSLVISGCNNAQVEGAGLGLHKLDTDVFIKYKFEEDGHIAWILIPNDDYVDVDKTETLSWRDYLYFSDELNVLAEECSFQQRISTLETQVVSNSGTLKERLSKQKGVLWDEKKLYGFKFTNLGSAYKTKCLDMLATLLRNRVEITTSNKAHANALAEIYPWLVITEKIIAKNPNECTSDVLGEALPPSIKDIIDIASQKPLTDDEIANKYFDVIGNREDIRGKPDNKAKDPVKYLVEALCTTFDSHFVLEDGRVQVQGAELGTQLSVSNQEWLFDMISTEKGVDALVHNVGVSSTRNFVSELSLCSSIFEEYQKDPDILSERVMSPYDRVEKKKRELLVRCEDWAKKAIISLNLNSQEARKTLDEIERNIRTSLKRFEKIMGIKGLVPEFKRKLEKAISGDKLELILKSVGAKRKQLETVKVLDKTNKDPDYDVWSNYLLDNERAFVNIHSINVEVTELKERCEEILNTENDDLNNFVNRENSNINKFRINVIKARMDYEDSKYGKKLRKMLDGDLASGVSPHDKDVKRIQKLSKLNALVTEGKTILTKLCEEVIVKSYDEYNEMVSNYEALTKKYSDAKRKDRVPREFDEVREHITREMQGYIVKVTTAIQNDEDFKGAALEGPVSRKENYLRKVRKTTKKLLSSSHKAYLNEALKSINSSRLLRALLAIKDEKGEDELFSRLEFLKDMEEVGIITYNE